MAKKTENLETLLDDVRYIRNTMLKSKDTIKKWMYSPYIRFITFYAGAVILAFCVLEFYFITVFQGYNSVPALVRTLLITGFILAMSVTPVVKLGSLLAYSDRPRTSIVSLVIRLFGPSLMVNYLVILIIMTALSVFFTVNGMAHYIVPVISVGFGLVLFQMGNQFNMVEGAILGLWPIVTGLIGIPFIAKTPRDAWLWLGVSMSLGFILFAVYIQVKSMMKKG